MLWFCFCPVAANGAQALTTFALSCNSTFAHYLFITRVCGSYLGIQVTHQNCGIVISWISTLKFYVKFLNWFICIICWRVVLDHIMFSFFSLSSVCTLAFILMILIVSGIILELTASLFFSTLSASLDSIRPCFHWGDVLL